jgi:cysteine desulfurase
MYGPKGIGALFVRGGARRWPWAHPFRGGGQESGLRPGTSNVPAIVGFGEACVLASTTLKENGSYLSLLSGRFHRELTAVVSNAQLINDLDASLPGTLSIILPGVSADILIAHCKKINISRGSACNGAIGSSHVLNEVVQDEHLKESVIRVSFGKDSSAESFHEFFEILEKIKLGAVGNE